MPDLSSQKPLLLLAEAAVGTGEKSVVVQMMTRKPEGILFLISHFTILIVLEPLCPRGFAVTLYVAQCSDTYSFV